MINRNFFRNFYRKYDIFPYLWGNILKIIAFAIVLRVKKIAKLSKTALKAMVNAHVIHVGIFLVGCQVFGDTS